MTNIEKVAVIGAGVMGAGIAAHLVNSGKQVFLLDVSEKLAAAGIQRQIKVRGFMDPDASQNIKTGSIEEDMHLISDADWIIEAVSENIAIKAKLYRTIEGVRKPGSIISSNTSTIPLSILLDGLSEDFRSHFLITHFFNPPRFMRLFELVAGPETLPAVSEQIQSCADISLGKAVVHCKDTPGFIANRIGTYWMLLGQIEAIDMGMDIEEVDAVISKPFGIPSTGLFGLIDLIGIELTATIAETLQKNLPEDDAIQSLNAYPSLINQMIAENRLGRKTGAGFVRLSKDRKTKEITDLQTGDYRPHQTGGYDCLKDTKGNLRALMEHPGKGGTFVSRVMELVLKYSAELVPEIANSPKEVDEAMRYGYAWKQGPFELIDSLGIEWFIDRLKKRDEDIPDFLLQAAKNGGFYTVIDGNKTCLLPDGGVQTIKLPEGVISFHSLDNDKKQISSTETANLWDLGDGVAGLEIRTKMNTFNLDLFKTIENYLEQVGDDFKALVIGSDANHFSAGADLQYFSQVAHSNDTAQLDRFIETGQQLFKAIKFSPFPIVGAASGMALGGGCEVLLHCDAIQAHAELNMGLVETNVGIVPGWGGCKEMLLIFSKEPSNGAGKPVDAALKVFGLIASARVSGSAIDARKLGFLKPTDAITMNRDRLLADAKITALKLAETYTPPVPEMIILSGEDGAALLKQSVDKLDEKKKLTSNDKEIYEVVIEVLTNCAVSKDAEEVSEDYINTLERKGFLKLIDRSASIERIDHMLKTGKALRN